MKVICHIEDDLHDADMILVGRAISHLRRNKPEGIGALRYEGSGVIVSYIKNKNSYSIWTRREDEGRTN